MKIIGVSQRVVYSDFGEIRDCLDQQWTQLLSRIGLLTCPLPNLTGDIGSLFNSINPAGVILSGGNDLASIPESRNTSVERDDFESRLIDFCIEKDTPLLGVCRGLQLIADKFGGEIVPVQGHVATSHELQIVDSSLEVKLPTHVNSFHNYGVKLDNQSELIPLAVDKNGNVEMLRHKSKRIFGIMWHPERDPRCPLSEELMRSIFDV